MSPSQWLLLVVLSVLWGGSFFCVGVAVRELPALTLVLARVGLAALTLLPLVWTAGLRRPSTWQAWMPFLGMSVLNNVAPFLLIANGQKEVASGLAAVVNASTPVWALLAGRLLGGDGPMPPHKLIGALIGIAGVAALVGPEALLGMRSSAWGMLLILGGAMCYGLSALWGRRLREEPPLLTAFCQLFCSTLLLAPVTLLVDRPWTLPLPSWQASAAILALAVLSTALAYIVFFRILAVSGPANAMLVTLLNPVSAILLGVLVLGETLLARHVLGAVVIASALIVIDGRIAGAIGRSMRRRCN
jgi:drug/metabolite transporter (DMT)-like permease